MVAQPPQEHEPLLVLTVINSLVSQPIRSCKSLKSQDKKRSKNYNERGCSSSHLYGTRLRGTQKNGGT